MSKGVTTAAMAAADAGNGEGDETTEPPVTDQSIRPSSVSPFTVVWSKRLVVLSSIDSA